MKTYSTIVVDSLATQYADIATTSATITTQANIAFKKALSTKASFKPGPGAGKGKFEIQRRKRIKRKKADTTAGHGQRFIARLDNASKLDWETIETFPGVKYDFLINIEPGDESNFANDPSQFIDGINTAATNQIISSEEDNIQKILDNALVKKIRLGTAAGDDLETIGEAIFNTFSLIKTNLTQFSDDFKHMANVTTHISRRGSDALKAFKGTMFNVDASRYADSIVPNFTWNNEGKGFVNGHFDKFIVDQSANGGDANERVVGILLDDESYFDSGYMNNTNDMNQKLLDEQFTGHSYWGCSEVIDPLRIVVVTALMDTDLVDLVNK